MQLPPDAWPDKLIIDGAECRGCYRQIPRRIFDNNDTYETVLDCWIELPRCSCPPCKVYCGSEVIFDGDQFEVTGPGDTDDRNCLRWNLKEVCNPCG